MAKKHKHQGTHIHWALILVFIILLGLALVWVIKPTQEQITPEIIHEKQTESDAYFKFIQDNLVSGGVGKDQIPAIDNPVYISASEAQLADEDQIFGVAYGDLVAAYPQVIMNWHEVVNEVVDGEKLAITYCPLTGSIIGYKGKNLGVSGALYNSNLVFYDRATDTLYPQILGKGINKPDQGEHLDVFPVTVTTWGQWKQKHPDTLVLSRNTGHDRNYERKPYFGYEETLTVWFPVAAQSDAHHSKKLVHGIEFGGESFALLKEHAAQQGRVDIKTSNGVLTATHDPITEAVLVTDELGNFVKSFDVYWFAWYAYHPDTKIIG